MFLTTLLCGSLNHWYWKTSLISHLAVISSSTPFSNLEELLESSYQITTEQNSAMHMDFQSAEHGIFQDLWLSKFLDAPKSLTKSTQASAEVATSITGYTLYADFNSAMHLKEYINCDLRFLDVIGTRKLLGLIFPKGSSLKDIFNKGIQLMIERGEMSRLIKKHAGEAPNCSHNNQMSLGFENIMSIFCIILLGFTMSFLIGLIEGLVFVAKRYFYNDKCQ